MSRPLDELLVCTRCCHDGVRKSQVFEAGWTLVAIETGRRDGDTVLLVLCPACSAAFERFMAETPTAEQIKEAQR